MNTMKKTIKILLIIVVTMVGNTPAFSQSIDQDRMERDLKVAENILATLSEDSYGGRRLWGRENVESSYVPDYGVIFTMPISTSFSFVGNNTIISTGGQDVIVIDESGDDPDYEVKVKGRNRVKVVDADSKEAAEARAEEGEEVRDQVITFLADYAGLIGQLKASERIVVQMKRSNRLELYFGSNQSSANQGLTAEVLKSDLNSQQQGKISRDQLIERIKFTGGANEDVAKDIELFATIFARLYEADLSSTYYLASRNIGYSKLTNLGVTFSMKFYSSSSNDGLHSIRTTGESGLTQAERNERVNAMYPDFEASFKENLLDYGRTVKSLNDNEKLIFKVRLTECKGCDMPKAIEVMVDAKTLAGYDKGSISRDKALAMIAVKRTEN